VTTALLAALLTVWVPGFEPAMTANGMAHWDTQPVGYRVHHAGSDDISDGSDLAAVRASFAAWTDLPGAAFAFRFDGLTNLTATAGSEGSEGSNLVVWRENPAEWVADGNSPLYYAITTLSFDKCSAALVDADIEVNGGYHTFSTSDDSVAVDIQNVLTHEVGHVVGLDHSADSSAVMYAKAAAGETSKRILKQDDLEGVRYLYPAEGDPPWLEQHDGCGGGCAVQRVGAGGASAGGAIPLALAVVALVCLRLGRRGAVP